MSLFVLTLSTEATEGYDDASSIYAAYVHSVEYHGEIFS